MFLVSYGGNSFIESAPDPTRSTTGQSTDTRTTMPTATGRCQFNEIFGIVHKISYKNYVQ
jgi:hypothetical protein